MYVKIVCSACDSLFKDKKGTFNTQYVFELNNERVTANVDTKEKISEISDLTEETYNRLEHSNNISDHIKFLDYTEVKEVLTLCAEAIGMLREGVVINIEYYLGSRNKTSNSDGFRDLNQLEKKILLKSLNNKKKSENITNPHKYFFRILSENTPKEQISTYGNHTNYRKQQRNF